MRICVGRVAGLVEMSRCDGRGSWVALRGDVDVEAGGCVRDAACGRIDSLVVGDRWRRRKKKRVGQKKGGLAVAKWAMPHLKGWASDTELSSSPPDVPPKTEQTRQLAPSYWPLLPLLATNSRAHGVIGVCQWSCSRTAVVRPRIASGSVAAIHRSGSPSSARSGEAMIHSHVTDGAVLSGADRSSSDGLCLRRFPSIRE